MYLYLSYVDIIVINVVVLTAGQAQLRQQAGQQGLGGPGRDRPRGDPEDSRGSAQALLQGLPGLGDLPMAKSQGRARTVMFENVLFDEPEAQEVNTPNALNPKTRKP